MMKQKPIRFGWAIFRMILAIVAIFSAPLIGLYCGFRFGGIGGFTLGFIFGCIAGGILLCLLMWGLIDFRASRGLLCGYAAVSILVVILKLNNIGGTISWLTLLMYYLGLSIHLIMSGAYRIRVMPRAVEHDHRGNVHL